GPGLAWLDWDADGWEDLAVGAGAGGKISLFRNNQKDGWERVNSTPWNQPLERDALGMALMWKGGVSGLCVASASYQETSSSPPPTLELFPEAPRTSPLPALHSSASITALADIDGDGDLDLFVGGRVVGGRYPEPASSAIHRYDSGTWVLDETNAKALTGFGLVTGGLWSDLDGDGDPDLAVTCEWGTVRVLLNQGGVLKESTQELGFAGHSGWWNGLAGGDFDGDGRMDLVAANWGLNGRHALDSSNGVRVYHGDYDGDGTVDMLEASFEPGRSTWVPERDLLVIGKALPFVRDTFSTHAAFSRASIADVLGGRASSAGAPLAARYFETTLWLNRGGRFEPQPLPMEAQMSPVFGISVADMDGNGTEDLFLTQNFFGTHAQAFRSDAGRGLVVLGDGKAGFRTLRASESGVSLVGEGRGVAACDFDGDGKVDVAAAMNGAETIVYRNVSKNAGIRVRVNAGTNNPGGIGVQLRAFSEEEWGPVRELRSGSGTGSQDSLIQVLHRPGRITRIQARWPQGKVTEHKPPADLGNSVFLVQPSN
ncbi:MAG: VCBS repeat-containing protein, partial [Verrucomicrobia bacterium]|nr:VCBS repeat-containing protein [Verrucomicrobiota bacterium]